MKKQILEKQLEFPFMKEARQEEPTGNIRKYGGWLCAGAGAVMTAVGAYAMSITTTEELAMIGGSAKYLMKLHL